MGLWKYVPESSLLNRFETQVLAQREALGLSLEPPPKVTVRGMQLYLSALLIAGIPRRSKRNKPSQSLHRPLSLATEHHHHHSCIVAVY